MQKFRPTDIQEDKVTRAFKAFTNLAAAEKSIFYNEAYSAYPLGDALYEANAHPLARAIPQDTFRQSFSAINDLFTRPGTFEFYLEVFRAIWGDSVEVQFVIPFPGVLNAYIDSLSIDTPDFLAREIVEDAYQFPEVIDHDGDNIAFQFPIGLRTQSEIDALMAELSVYGIFTEVFLTTSSFPTLQYIPENGIIELQAVNRQHIRVVGESGPVDLNVLPFGSNPALFIDGMIVIIEGHDDDDTVTFKENDATYGYIGDGDIIMRKRSVVVLTWNVNQQRFKIVSTGVW